jgi:hypothetical protein
MKIRRLRQVLNPRTRVSEASTICSLSVKQQTVLTVQFFTALSEASTKTEYDDKN